MDLPWKKTQLDTEFKIFHYWAPNSVRKRLNMNGSDGNKLESLEVTQVRNYDPLTHRVSDSQGRIVANKLASSQARKLRFRVRNYDPLTYSLTGGEVQSY